MTLSAWVLLALFGGSQHADSEALRAAARHHGVPVMVMEGIAAVESGYSGRNDVRGAAGEIGRMQIMPQTARNAGCPEPVTVRLREHGFNLACGARILRRCYEDRRSWAGAVQCFNAPALPAAPEYLRKVETEIGRQQLARLR